MSILLLGSSAIETVRVTVGDHSVANTPAGTPASAGIKVLRNGQIHTGNNSFGLSPAYSDVGGGEWAEPESATVGDTYEVRMVTVSGTLSSGTADSWLALTSDREFNVQQTSNGSKAFSGTLEIRRNGVVLDSGSISLTATAVTI